MINVSNDLYNDAAAITLSDTVNHTWTFDAFYVGSAGTVVLVLENGVTATFVGCLAGTIYRLRGIRINNTSTTASNLVGLRYK